MKILTIVGARPQFVKAATVSRAIRNEHAQDVTEFLVHTGQHYDQNMSDIFFEELDIPKPDRNLSVHGGSHGQMTGRMMAGIDELLMEQKPDWVLVYGDTNSTLAGALCAAKLHIPVAHVEAGLRSFNMRMPEEVNRVLADRVSKKLYCPTGTAVENLAAEGVVDGVENVGDVMFDAALYYKGLADNQSQLLGELELENDGFVLSTCHRAENTDNPSRLQAILAALAEIGEEIPVVLPLHPRTHGLVKSNGFENLLDNIRIVEPVGYLDMIALEKSAKAIVTDSGGVQKEAFFFGKNCVTMRDETEWVETVKLGANVLVGSDHDLIVKSSLSAVQQPFPTLSKSPYGEGHSASNIVSSMLSAA